MNETKSLFITEEERENGHGEETNILHSKSSFTQVMLTQLQGGESCALTLKPSANRPVNHSQHVILV